LRKRIGQPVKHAGQRALNQLEPVLVLLRNLPGLKERKRGLFDHAGRAFLHFHEDPAGFFADLRVGDDFVRLPVNSKREIAMLVRQARRAVEA